MDYNLNTTLESTSRLNFTGNIIPHAWYSKITFGGGKVDLIAIILLAEIVYWYRLVEIKDEHTGRFLGYKKKFAKDMLQRSLQSFSDQFGLSKRQVSDALKRLEDAGLIIKQIRTIQISLGRLNNVMYVAPVPEKIAALDHDSNIEPEIFEIEQNSETSAVSPDTFERSRGYDETYQGIRSNAVGGTTERGTYTENTTKITTKITAAEKSEDKSEIAAAVFSTKLNSKPGDAIISESLSDYQLQAICDAAGNQPDLEKEIKTAILSKNSFSNAHPDFHKKLNTIKKLIKEGRWTTPAAVIQEKEVFVKKTLDPIIRELQEAELDYIHWESMLNLAIKKNQFTEIENYKKLFNLAKQNLESMKLRFENLIKIEREE